MKMKGIILAVLALLILPSTLMAMGQGGSITVGMGHPGCVGRPANHVAYGHPPYQQYAVMRPNAMLHDRGHLPIPSRMGHGIGCTAKPCPPVYIWPPPKPFPPGFKFPSFCPPQRPHPPVACPPKPCPPVACPPRPCPPKPCPPAYCPPIISPPPKPSPPVPPPTLPCCPPVVVPPGCPPPILCYPDICPSAGRH